MNSELRDLAKNVRIEALKMIHNAGSGHPGGALSCADVLSYLAKRELGWPAYDQHDLNRNRLILSKGHACPALYACAAELGLISKDELDGFRKLGRRLQGHPDIQSTPWVETSTGSLGQGFSVGLGMALGIKHAGGSGIVYVLLGDGEIQEGEVWEAAMSAGHYRLSNLVAILDYNKLQSDDRNENIMGLEPLRPKWEAFGWRVEEVDGHDFDQIENGINAARSHGNGPTIIIAHTIKGRGVTYMENVPKWHGSVKLRDEELSQAISELAQAPTIM